MGRLAAALEKAEADARRDAAGRQAAEVQEAVKAGRRTARAMVYDDLARDRGQTRQAPR